MAAVSEDTEFAKYCTEASADADIDQAAESVSQKLSAWMPKPQHKWRPGNAGRTWVQDDEFAVWQG
jgi:hypothetical protein